MIRTLLNKLKHVIKLTYLTSSQQDGVNFYNAQVTGLDNSSQSVIFYPYGHYASAPKGSLGLTFNILNNEENQVTIPHCSENRITGLKSGEVVIANPGKGTSIKLDAEGNIIITGEVTINGNVMVNGTVTVDDDMQVEGNIASTGDITLNSGSEDELSFGDHIHTITVDTVTIETSTPISS